MMPPNYFVDLLQCTQVLKIFIVPLREQIAVALRLPIYEREGHKQSDELKDHYIKK